MSNLFQEVPELRGDINRLRQVIQGLENSSDPRSVQRAQVLRLYYGTGEEGPMNARQIEGRLCLGSRRARDIRQRAVKDLRSLLRRKDRN